MKNHMFFDITIQPPFTCYMNFGPAPLGWDFSIFGTQWEWLVMKKSYISFALQFCLYSSLLLLFVFQESFVGSIPIFIKFLQQNKGINVKYSILLKMNQNCYASCLDFMYFSQSTKKLQIPDVRFTLSSKSIPMEWWWTIGWTEMW